MSPLLGVVILVFITLVMAASIAPIVYDAAKVEEKPGGVEVTFEESRNGSVNVRVVEMGTADELTVHTEYLERTVTTSGETVSVYPGEGTITIIAKQDDVRVVAQTYKPKWGPDEPLAAIIDGDLKKYPGQDYTFNASNSLGAITEYRWDFDQDGTTDATGETVTTNWTRPGIYKVSLTVRDDDGYTHTSTVSVTNTHLTVAQDGTGDYRKIQWAIDNASSGWSIYVKDTGQYEERVTVNRPALTIFSDDYAAINGEFLSGTTAGVNISEDDVKLRGLRVRRFTNGPAITVNSSADNVVLNNMYVDESGADSEYGGAVYIERGVSGMNISNSRVLSNNGTCAITLGDNSYDSGGPYVTIDNTDIRSNGGHGLCAYDSVMRLDLTDSTFRYNERHGAFLGDGDAITVQDTVFRRNGISDASNDAAVFVSQSEYMVLERLTVVNNADSGLDSANTPENLTIRNSRFDANGNHGLALDEATNSTVVNVSARFNEGYGMALLSKTNNLTVNQSRMNANNKSGVFMAKQVKDVKLNETIIRLNTEHGLHLDRADSVYVTDVNFTDNGGSAGEFHGVYIRGTTGNDPEDIIIRYSHLYGTNNSEEDIVAENSAKTIDAAYNWWGANETPTTDQYSGDINVTPICEEPDCSGVR